MKKSMLLFILVFMIPACLLTSCDGDDVVTVIESLPYENSISINGSKVNVSIPKTALKAGEDLEIILSKEGDDDAIVIVKVDDVDLATVKEYPTKLTKTLTEKGSHSVTFYRGINAEGGGFFISGSIALTTTVNVY